MNRDTDVLVVGGGATGVGVARDLAMRGVDVTLCERDGLASGTTGRSHGVLHSGARYADADAAGARECIAENRLLKAIAGECVEDSGGLFVELETDDADYFDEKLAACREQGIETRVLGGDEAREAVPALSDRTKRAIRVPDGVVYPSRLVAATAESAREHGAQILSHAPVVDLSCESGAVVGARVERDGIEAIRAEHVVNAAGAWAAELAARAGVGVELSPTSGVMVAVDFEGIEPVLNRCRPPSDGDLVVPHDSQVVLGTTSVEVDDPNDYDTDREEVQRMVNECAAMVPALDGVDVSRAYWGVRPLYAPDETERPDTRSISRGFFLLDHAADGVSGFTSIVGGKLTTHRKMAEAVADHVCEQLGVSTECRTANESLPRSEDPAALDELVEEFEAVSPADSDMTEA